MLRQYALHYVDVCCMQLAKLVRDAWWSLSRKGLIALALERQSHIA